MSATLGNQYCNALKTPRVQVVYSFSLYYFKGSSSTKIYATRSLLSRNNELAHLHSLLAYRILTFQYRITADLAFVYSIHGIPLYNFCFIWLILLRKVRNEEFEQTLFAMNILTA